MSIFNTGFDFFLSFTIVSYDEFAYHICFFFLTKKHLTLQIKIKNNSENNYITINKTVAINVLKMQDN